MLRARKSDNHPSTPLRAVSGHEGTQRRPPSFVRGGNLVTSGGWAHLELSFGYLREWGNGC
jgi:hypothetical protein